MMNKVNETVAIGILVLGTFSIVPHAMGQTTPRNVEMAQKAWEALAESHYDEAVRAGTSCVAVFGAQAAAIQAKLIADNEPDPVPWEINSATEQQVVFARGPLNDVAACLFVKLAAEVASNSREAALKTYRDLGKLRHALIWDPRGSFFGTPSTVL